MIRPASPLPVDAPPSLPGRAGTSLSIRSPSASGVRALLAVPPGPGRARSAPSGRGLSVPGARALGAALGVAADELFGEPPRCVHPVAAFGAVMRRIEAGRYRDSRPAGIVHAGTGVVIGAVAGVALRAGSGLAGAATRGGAGGPGGGPMWNPGGLAASALATGLAVAGRDLRRTAGEVAAALDAGDREQARALLPALVGRDPSQLDEKQMARAAVESVAENTVDAVVAPALWGALGGAPGAFAYRAVNTLDAMVGHRTARYRRYGWASARLDDLAGWVPARVTAALVVAVRPGRARAVREAVRSDAPGHPSPNSGVAEAAFAAALGLRLGGWNRYDGEMELRPALGTGPPPEWVDIARAIRLSRDVGRATALLLAAIGAILGRLRRGRSSPMSGEPVCPVGPGDRPSRLCRSPSPSRFSAHLVGHGAGA